MRPRNFAYDRDMTNPEIAPSRQAATVLGLKLYHGLPCTKGHGTVRSMNNNACVECNRLSGLANKAANADRERARKAAYRKANPDKIKAQRMRRKARDMQKAKQVARDAEKTWRAEVREAKALARAESASARKEKRARATDVQRQSADALREELAYEKAMRKALEAEVRAIRKDQEL